MDQRELLLELLGPILFREFCYYVPPLHPPPGLPCASSSPFPVRGCPTDCRLRPPLRYYVPLESGAAHGMALEMQRTVIPDHRSRSRVHGAVMAQMAPLTPRTYAATGSAPRAPSVWPASSNKSSESSEELSEPGGRHSDRTWTDMGGAAYVGHAIQNLLLARS